MIIRLLRTELLGYGVCTVAPLRVCGLAIALAACGHAVYPPGSIVKVECKKWDHAECYERAAAACPNGYVLMPTAEESPFVSAGPFSAALFVECRAGAPSTAAPATAPASAAPQEYAP